MSLVNSENIPWKLSRMRLLRNSNFLFLWDRDFSRLHIFKSNETEPFPRMQFWIFWDQKFPRLGKNGQDRDFFETLADFYESVHFMKLNEELRFVSRTWVWPWTALTCFHSTSKLKKFENLWKYLDLETPCTQCALFLVYSFYCLSSHRFQFHF